MNVNIIGKFYLGNGGIGDALIFLSTFYDEVEEANVIFLANDITSIRELLNYFPKLQKKLILQNDFVLLRELYSHPNCIGTGILPKNLDYSQWYKVDIFKTYGVKQFPDFMNLFDRIKVAEKQLFVQPLGSQVEGYQKRRVLLEPARDEMSKLVREGWKLIGSAGMPGNQKDLKTVFGHIRGSDLVIGVDSFAKTVSAMSRIKTIVYDNVYNPEYLKRFKDGIDYGHYVFIFPWSYIEFRRQ